MSMILAVITLFLFMVVEGYEDVLKFGQVYDMEMTNMQKPAEFKFYYEEVEDNSGESETKNVVLNYYNYLEGMHQDSASNFKVEGKTTEADVQTYFDSNLLIGKAKWIFNQNFIILPLNHFNNWEFKIGINPIAFAGAENDQKSMQDFKRIKFGIGIFGENNINIFPRFITPGYLRKTTNGTVLTLKKKHYEEGKLHQLEIVVCEGYLGQLELLKYSKNRTKERVELVNNLKKDKFSFQIIFEEQTVMMRLRVTKLFQHQEVFFKAILNVFRPNLEGIKADDKVNFTIRDLVREKDITKLASINAEGEQLLHSVYELVVEETESSKAPKNLILNTNKRFYAFPDYKSASFMSKCGYPRLLFNHYLTMNFSKSTKVVSFEEVIHPLAIEEVKQPIVVDVRLNVNHNLQKDDQLGKKLLSFGTNSFIFLSISKSFERDFDDLGVLSFSSDIQEIQIRNSHSQWEVPTEAVVGLGAVFLLMLIIKRICCNTDNHAIAFSEGSDTSGSIPPRPKTKNFELIGRDRTDMIEVDDDEEKSEDDKSL